MQDQPRPQAPAAGGRGVPPPNPPQQPGRRGFVQAPGIVFDSDMGRSIDAALALAVLHNLGAKGRVVGVTVSHGSLEAAAFCDAVGRFYTGDTAAQATGMRSTLPVGLADDAPKLGEAPMLAATLAAKTADGQAAFRHAVHDVADTGDFRIIIRNALMTQQPGQGIVLLAGPATNLVRTMAMKGAREVISERAGLLIVAAGSYPEGSVDPRIRADVRAARQLFAEWPTPIIAVGTEIGAAIPYPARSIDADFSWASEHPVAAAYRAHRAMPYDAPSQAVVAALYAGNQKEDYFQLSEPGTIEVLDDGRTRFVPSAGGRSRFVKVEPARRERLVAAFTALASAKPAPPQRPFRPPQINQAVEPAPASKKQ
jgi:hypothetical protein